MPTTTGMLSGMYGMNALFEPLLNATSLADALLPTPTFNLGRAGTVSAFVLLVFLFQHALCVPVAPVSIRKSFVVSSR